MTVYDRSAQRHHAAQDQIVWLAQRGGRHEQAEELYGYRGQYLQLLSGWALRTPFIVTKLHMSHVLYACVAVRRAPNPRNSRQGRVRSRPVSRLHTCGREPAFLLAGRMQTPAGRTTNQRASIPTSRRGFRCGDRSQSEFRARTKREVYAT